MQKILFISHSASRTGAPLMLLQTAHALSVRGFECSFVMGDDGPLVKEFQKLGEITIEPLYPSEVKYWREIKRVSSRFAILQKAHPGLVYCNTIHTAKWLFYARMRGLKTLMHVHELSMGFANLGWQERFMIKRCAHRFIAASDAVRKYLVDIQGVVNGIIDVVPSSIDTQYFASRNPFAANISKLKSDLRLDNSVVIGNIGRITHMKGTDLLLEVAALVKKNAPGRTIKYLLIGTTDDPAFYAKWKALLHERNLQDDVVIVENQNDVRPYYAIMDMYLSTAREDPFPLVVLEAMASSLPVVAFAVGGIPEQIADESGVLVDGLDIQRMSEQILSLITNPQYCAQLGRVARDRVQRHFDVSVTAPKFESILRAMNE